MSAAAPRPSVWAIIPSRYGSTRFPGKPLALLGGKPMVQHVFERVSRAPGIALAVVATDDGRIFKTVEGFGGKAVMTGEQPTGTDRVNEAVKLLCAKQAAPEYVLNVQGDEPFIDPANLERLIQGMAARPEAQMGTLVLALQAEALREYPHQGKVVMDRQGRALYFSRAPIPYRMKPGYTGYQTMGVYLFRTAFLHIFAALPQTPLAESEQLEQLRALEHGHAIHCFEAQGASMEVNTPEDLVNAEAHLQRITRR